MTLLGFLLGFWLAHRKRRPQRATVIPLRVNRNGAPDADWTGYDDLVWPQV